MKDQLDESLEVYTPQEIEYLDKYLPHCNKIIEVTFFNIGRRAL